MSSLQTLQTELKAKLRQYQDFPSKGIVFEDILPIFQDPKSFQQLIDAFQLHIKNTFGDKKIDVIVGLDARGFLFGPTLALAIGAAFVPVRKEGKLPGKTVRAEFQKEYGKDVFEIQEDAIKPGQTVIVVDDIIATGGSAACAGSLVSQLKGEVLEFIFILELLFLKGRDKLNAPAYTLLSGQE